MGLVAVAGVSRPLALFLVALAATCTLAMIVYKSLYLGRYLPEPALGALDRHTGRLAARQKATRVTTIDAKEFAAKLKARMINRFDLMHQTTPAAPSRCRNGRSRFSPSRRIRTS